MDKELKRLEKIDLRIQEIAAELGLSVKAIDFEIVPAERMFEIMAYRLPVNFRHWSRGRDYERTRTIYEHSGSGLPYESVLNTDPPKAYLMETNPFSIQVLVMAHVYGHVDFFIENQNFSATPPDILVRSYEAVKRFAEYEQLHGISKMEPLIDAGLALEFNIDPDIHKKRESRKQQIERLSEKQEHQTVTEDDFHHLFPRPKKQRPGRRDLMHQALLEPTRDILGYITENSPKPLQDWEKDVLEVIATQGRYFYPQIRTKIINEGWASYCHEKIMRQLFKEKYLTAEEHGYYARYHSAVLQPHKFQINPYHLGKKIFEDIEMRWDKGRFGKEWKESGDVYEREHWDTKLGEGYKKILAVRKLYSDRMLIEHFLTDDLIHELKLYIYQERQGKDGKRYLVIVENRPEVIRHQLKSFHADMGIPRILIKNVDRKNGIINLIHKFEDAPLDQEYLKKTLEHVNFIWGRDVHLDTIDVEIDKSGKAKYREVTYRFNGYQHSSISQELKST